MTTTDSTMRHANPIRYFIGMMSGTSLDAVDAVLAAHDEVADQWTVLAHAETSLPADLKKTLYDLNFPNRLDNELHTAKVAEQQLTVCYAEAYRALMAKTALSPADIDAIASHGQTIRHLPMAETPYTLQLLNGALLSQLTGQTVVCDFRSKDIACGGQGAPLAPLFHRGLFAAQALPFAVVNIGGISNISLLTEDDTRGFDCGPGNCLLDEWVQQYRGKAYDANGDWARQGEVLPTVLARCLQDAYFHRSPPKSTGRDYFHRAWLDAHLRGDERPADVMRTLVALTATAIADSVPSRARSLIIVGGGAKNTLLVEDIAARLPHLKVTTSERLGIDAQHVEALGFALLGRATLHRQAIDARAVTGARCPAVLGALYCAN